MQLKLPARIALLIGGTLLVSILVLTLLFSTLFDRFYHYETDVQNQRLHGVLAEGLARLVVEGRPLAARDRLRRLSSKDPVLVYLYLTDFDGGLFAHSFEQGFPRALLSTLKMPAISRHLRYRLGADIVDHYSSPLIDGMRARIHIGVSDAPLTAAKLEWRGRAFLVATVVLLLGVAVSLVMARRMGRPLIRLATLLDRLGRGESVPPEQLRVAGPPEVRRAGEAAADMVEQKERLTCSLQEREAWLSTLFETAPVGLALTRMDGQLAEVNPAYAGIIGRTVDQTLQLTYWDITPEEYAEQEQAQLASLEASGRYGPYEKHYIHRDGHWVPVRLSGLIVERGGERFIWSVVEDITALRQAERLEEHLRRLFQEAHEEIYIFDGESLRFRQASQGALANLQYDADALCEITPVDIKPEYAEEQFREMIAPLRKGELESLHFETLHRRRDGSTYPVEIHLQYLDDPDGGVFFALVMDLTERKAAEAALREHRDHLEALVRERTGELQASNAELESFAYSVSHDLRAPLRAIDGFSQALVEDYGDQLDEAAHDYVRRVRTAAQRMGQLIDDLLELSRVGRAELRMEKVDLAQLAREVLDELRAAEPDRSVEFSCDEDLGVMADPRLMRVLVDNLLGNAWKFSAREAVSRISFGRLRDDPSVFYIRDNGVGFDMRHADKLFGAFQRLHRVTDFPGTGVGLATVQRILRRHGGRIRAEAVEGEGATFYFTFNAASPAGREIDGMQGESVDE